MACPVCFNAAASDETVRASLNTGILVMMGVTVGVLAGFLRFILSIVRRSDADLNEADLKVRLYEYRNESTDVEADVEAGLQARLPI